MHSELCVTLLHPRASSGHGHRRDRARCCVVPGPVRELGQRLPSRTWAGDSHTAMVGCEPLSSRPLSRRGAEGIEEES